MTQSAIKTKTITLSAIFAALGACVQIIEGYIPTSFPLPGGRLGLSNVVTMVILEKFGLKYALAVAAVKSLIAMLLSGNASALPYSLAGGIVSVLLMALSFKLIKGIGHAGCGIIGAWSSNIAQTAVGAVIMSNIHILSYIWILGPVSVVTGAFTGILADFIGRTLLWTKK
ncbi:MAG: Gx transporter family protein [Monoglobales bacterium]